MIRKAKSLEASRHEMIPYYVLKSVSACLWFSFVILCDWSRNPRRSLDH